MVCFLRAQWRRRCDASPPDWVNLSQSLFARVSQHVLVTEQDWLNFILHTEHSNGCTPLCINSYLCNVSRRRNCLPQVSQVNLFSDICVNWWAFRVIFSFKVLPHASQRDGLSSEWVDIWADRAEVCTNPFSQTLHTWFFSLTWTPKEWVLRSLPLRNRLPQSWKEYRPLMRMWQYVLFQIFFFIKFFLADWTGMFDGIDGIIVLVFHVLLQTDVSSSTHRALR